MSKYNAAAATCKAASESDDSSRDPTDNVYKGVKEVGGEQTYTRENIGGSSCCIFGNVPWHSASAC